MYYFIIPTSVKTLGTDITKNCDNLINIIGPRRFKTYFQICNPTSFYTYNDVNVTFDANGGEVDTESMLVDIYSHVDELPVPLRWNHKFLGWFTATEGGEQVTSSTSMTKDMTLYARWEAVEYEWSYEENDDGGITITGASPNEGNMEIPSEIDGKVVTAIGYEAFHSADALTGVKFPDGVKEIGQSAFRKCSRLSRLEFTEGLEYIGHSAFSYCWNIEEIKIPSSVKEVDAQAFYGTSATNIVLLEGIQRIGATAIPAHNVSSLVIPSSVSILGDGWEYDSCPIYGCDNLSVATGNAAFKMEDGLLLSMDGTRLISVNAGKTAISIPASVTSIDAGAFACYDWWNNEGGMFDFETIPGICLADGWMVGYRSDDVPLDLDLTHIRGIQALALMGCPAKTVKLPSQLVRIDGSCFIWCSNLQSVEIPISCVEIGDNAFGGCENLSSIIIPQNVANISSGAFWNCDNLQTVVVPKSLDIVTSQFDATTSVYYYEGEPPTSLSFAVIVLDAVGGDISTNNVRGVIKCDVGILPIPVRGGNIFLGWYTAAEGGEEVTSDTVVTGDMTLYAHWEKWPDVTFDVNGGEAVDETLRTMPRGEQIGELPVPLKWNHVFKGWFTAASGGEQIYDDSVVSESMTLYAHWEAVEYEWSYEENGDGGITITGASPREGNMEIPSEIDGKVVTSIGSGAFYSADALTGVKIPDTVRTIGGTAFGWSGLVYALIPDSVTYIGWEAFKCCDGLKRLSSIPQDAEIDWGAFQECPKLADENGFVIINNTVYGYFGDDANVVIPDGMTSIGYGLFWGNSSVTNVVIPTSVTRIESWAFYACRQLTSVTIPKGVTIIERVTFESCSSLTNVVIPEGVTDIDEAAFARCDSLTNIVIPASVTNIGEKAFYFCKSLESVTFVGGMDNVSISPDAFDKTPWAASTFPFELIINNGSVNGYHGGVPESLSLADYAGGQLTSIGSYAFEDCDGLQSVIIPTGVVSVAGNAFRECYNLSSVSLPDGLKTIGSQAFWAANLDTIYVPASVTTIGWGVFGLNYSLKTAYLPDTLRSMVEDNEAFIHCAEDLEITYYEVPMVTLTLNATGGEIEESSITIKKDCPVESLPIPTRDGYMFVGWFTAAEGGEEVTSDTVVTGDMTLYAHWRELNPPANDNFADATAISGASGSIAGTTFDSSYEAADLIPDSYDEHLTSTAWYRWTAPSDGRFSFSVADADTERGWTCAIGTTTGYDGDECVWTDADVRWGSVTIDATAGNAYWIEVGSYFDGEFDFTLSWCTCPANDEYETPELLESTESGSVGGTLLGATIAENDCIWKYGDAERTVWYKWVAPFTGSVAFTATAANGRSDLLYLVATRGYDEDKGWDDCGYDYGSRVVFDVDEGETYYVSLCTWNYVVSDFTLSWQRLVPPVNDNFADAVAISGVSGRVTGTNLGATVEDGETLPYEEEGNWTFGSTATAWWKWTAPVSDSVTFRTKGSDFDTVIGIYTGNVVDALETVAANDEGDDDGSSVVTFDAVAGTTYYIAVGGYENASGDVVLSWGDGEFGEYTVTFNPAGGAFADGVETNRMLVSGEAYGELPVPTRTGYTFTGWMDEDGATVTSDTIMGDGDVTVMAQWSANCYTVAFDANGGEGTMVPQTNTYDLVSGLTSNAFMRIGHTFAGWATNESGIALFADGDVVSNLTAVANGNVKFFAVWNVNQYTLTFDAAGGSDVAPITQDYGTAVTAPSVPTRTGYTFAGWGSELPATMPAEDVTYTAQWNVNQYTLTFDAAGGIDVAPITQDYGTAVTAPSAPTRTGYTFAGWSPILPATMPVDGASFTAQWNANGYTVAFDANGGEGEMDGASWTYDVVTNFASCGFVRTGHTFAGWATNEIGDALFTDGDVVSNLTAVANGNVKFFAVWNVNQYTLTFDAAGGSDVAPITQDYGTVVTAPSAPTRTGYTFAGWDSELPATMPAEDVTYTAQWNVNQYTFTFDAAGGSDVAPITQDYGTAVTAPSAPTKRGYTFAGWSPILPATMPVDGGSFTAQWTANNYTVTFDANGGEGTMAAQTCVYDVEQSLSECAFTRPAHEFVGWALAPGSDDVAYLDGAKVLNMTVAAGGRVTLYAVWERSTLWEPVVVDDGSLGGAEQGDEMFDGAAAETYDGYVYTEDGILKGTVQVKAAKAKLNRKTGKTVSKITVAIQLAGEKKVTAKGDLDLATVKFEATAGGRALSLAIGANGVTGRYGAYYIDGAQNKFTSKDASDKQEGAAALARWQGVYTLARRDADGWSGFSLTVAAKGKVKVQGVLVDGTKLSATSQLLVGEGGICAIPVVIAKKANVAFNVWLTDDGVEVVGLDGEVVVGKLASLKADVQFSLDVEAFSALLGDGTYAKYLPYGLAVAQNGTKWVVAGGVKAGKVQLAKDGTVDEAKAGENPSGLKLTYKAKDGTFKGSFKAYEDVNGKPKAVTVNVTGVLVDGVGYGSATIKKVGGVPVTVE